MKLYALFLGVNEYKDREIANLTGAEGDAVNLYSRFRDGLGLGPRAVRLAGNVSFQQVCDALQGIGEQLRAGDRFLFYFAGHGHEVADAVNGDQLLLLHGANRRLYEAGHLQGELLTLKVLETLTKAWPRGVTSLFVLDACRSAIDPAAPRGGNTAAFGTGQAIERLVARGPGKADERIVVLNACSAGELAFEVDGVQGGRLCNAIEREIDEHIRVGKPMVINQATIQALRVHIDAQQRQAGDRRRQTPWLMPPHAEFEVFSPTPGKAAAAPQRHSVLSGDNGRVHEAALGNHVKRSLDSHIDSRRVFNCTPFAVFRDTVRTVDLVAPEMVVVPAGRFRMGADRSETGYSINDGPPTDVVFAQPFAIGKYVVTFDEWQSFLIASSATLRLRDEGWGRGRRPAIHVSWADACGYCRWLSLDTGELYRLPSEAEWEYACRAGSTTRFQFGDVIDPAQANFVGTKALRDHHGTVPVATLGNANRWGVHDMRGNVWEWCADEWNATLDGQPADGRARVAGGTGNPFWRVIRGGSWRSEERNLRSACRESSPMGSTRDDVGFRVVRSFNG